MRQNRNRVLFILVMLFVITLGCAPGTATYDLHPAGFWAGLWHGCIIVLSFIISLFSDSVRVYEINNVGGWYDFGFLIGTAIVLGGSWGPSHKKKKAKSRKEQEWKEIGEKVENKIRKGIKSWLDEPEQKDKDWDEIAQKIEEKIKRELRDWAEN